MGIPINTRRISYYIYHPFSHSIDLFGLIRHSTIQDDEMQWDELVCSEQVPSYYMYLFNFLCIHIVRTELMGSVELAELALSSNSDTQILPTTVCFLGLLGVGGPCGRALEDDYNPKEKFLSSFLKLFHSLLKTRFVIKAGKYC